MRSAVWAAHNRWKLKTRRRSDDGSKKSTKEMPMELRKCQPLNSRNTRNIPPAAIAMRLAIRTPKRTEGFVSCQSVAVGVFDVFDHLPVQVADKGKDGIPQKQGPNFVVPRRRNGSGASARASCPTYGHTGQKSEITRFPMNGASGRFWIRIQHAQRQGIEEKQFDLLDLKGDKQGEQKAGNTNQRI